tara:strand:- start:1710 stop:2393 length:684 start_codon:yes stop_codon:yes gene_type:complete
MSQENEDSNETEKNNLETINQSLKSLFNYIKQSVGINENVIANQSKMKRIVNNTKNNLIDHKNTIDSEVNQQIRETEINNSRTKRIYAYNYIVLIVIFTIISCLCLKTLNNMNLLPNLFYNFLLLLIISISIMYCIGLYLDISKRDPIYFDKYVFAPPRIDTPSEIKNAEKIKALEKAQANLNSCNNEDCCHSGSTKWDTSLNKCVEIKETATDGFNNIFTNFGSEI